MHKFQHALLAICCKSTRNKVFLDAASGLRRSELLALKWGDIDFDELQINVRRSIYLNVVGNCKTEASSETCTYGSNPCLCALVLEARQPLTDTLMIGC